ncbi:MAG: DUF4124 domain-containing protein [Ectothiorhodospiraceae bacterium]|nr:DUF4124 domain-containing protein [Ectothiorhodospiraceae bacterium]MCH8504157.1 DUF4124 domain-containing protein [Ectothiorhodospiraceae bacterium]
MRNRTFFLHALPSFRLLSLPVLLLCLLLFATATDARNVYRWTDADGNTHFSDNPPPMGRQSETIRLPGRQASRSTPSPRVRQIRCRDFRGALEQLRELDDVEPDNARWLAAKQVASNRIAQWCE